MSDGPHRSLKMRPAWKRAAERLDLAAWSANARADAVCEAIGGDFGREIPAEVQAAVRKALGVDGQPSLFRDQVSRDIEGLRARPDLSSLAHTLIDYACLAVQRGVVGAEAYAKAVQNTCLDHGAEGARQIEEHYKREVPALRAQNVRKAAETALLSPQFDALCQSITSGGIGNFLRHLPKKQTELDAGPELSK